MKIIALLDASVYAKSVCDHVAWIATRTGAAVDVVHVLGRRETTTVTPNLSGSLEMNANAVLLEELAEFDRQKARVAQERGRLIVDQAKAVLLAAGVASVTPRLRTGDLVETIHELETEADLIVIGKRGEGADFAKLHLGSNLERVVRSSHKPVLVASRAFKPISRFMIAFDNGLSTRKVVEYIAGGSILAGLEANILHAGKENPVMLEALDWASAQLRQKGYSVRAEIVDEDAERLISERVASQNIDLLVMGAYGHSRIRNLFVGSTTTEMIRSCKVPILLYR